NRTTDPALRSFLPVLPESHFPIQNLPYGVLAEDAGAAEKIGVAIGDRVLDLTALDEFGLLNGLDAEVRNALRQDRLNRFAALGRPAWQQARAAISRLLSADEPA